MLRIGKVDESSFAQIPRSCRYCLYWQTTGEFGEQMLTPEKEKEKRDWHVKVTSEFGNCLKVAYLDGAPIGFAQYALPKQFPRTGEYASGPVGGDAVLVACLYISVKEARRQGLGTAILRDLIAELKDRQFRAIETFAGKRSENNPSGPLEFYLKHGFKVKNGNSDFPLVRLEL